MRRTCWVLLLASIACEGEDAVDRPVDATPDAPADAEIHLDAEVTDADRPDADVMSDTGAADAEPSDAAPLDAELMDAGEADAMAPDATTFPVVERVACADLPHTFPPQGGPRIFACLTITAMGCEVTAPCNPAPTSPTVLWTDLGTFGVDAYALNGIGDFLTASPIVVAGPVPVRSIPSVPPGVDETVRLRTPHPGVPAPPGAPPGLWRTRYFDLTYRSDPLGLLISSVIERTPGEDCPGAPVRCTRVGNPLWSIVDWNTFAAPGGVATGTTVWSLHEYYSDATGFSLLGPDPAQPHALPYDGEVTMGLAAAGFTSTTTFSTSELIVPSAIWFMSVIVPSPSAPLGSSPDFASGPIWDLSWHPLIMDGDLRRDGAIVDPFFDATYPEMSQVMPPLPGTSYSHMTFGFWEDSNYIPALAGAYELEFHLVDGTHNGWDIVVLITVVP